ncbi:MAG: hypothetical protein K2G26_01065, partial [Clostridia bacterium]|nr:hypothetical protein [Clostridia bacterium]
PNPNPGGETQTITVIDDFSAANGKEYTLSPSASTAKYFDSATKLYIYVDNQTKSISTTKDYIKLESATKIKFITTSQLPTGAKLVLTMGDLTGVSSDKIPSSVKVTAGSSDSNINIVDNKVTIDLVSGTTYILGRVSGETRIASISIIIPANT